MSRIRRSTAGFSLLELMVVVIILAILSAVTVAEFSGTREEAHLRASARRLVMLLRLSHSQAVTTHKIHRLALKVDTGRFWIEALREGDRTDRHFAPTTHLPRSQGGLEKGISMRIRRPAVRSYQSRQRRGRTSTDDESPLEVIHFRPDGTADARDVELSDTQGFVLQLTIDPTTARVSLTSVGRTSVP